jgi:hypothetical protein
VIFFPTRTSADAEFLGISWANWVERPTLVPVSGWRSDQDLLANTQSGAALPVGKLQVRRYRGLAGDATLTPLATLDGGAPLLARLTTDHGGVYFCATTPAEGDSSLATEGVVLYVATQRALAEGAASNESTRQAVAGRVTSADEPGHWKKVAGDDDSLSTEYALHAGVYESGERLIAVNRAASEDGADVTDEERVAGLFRGLDFARVDDQAGNMATLIHEIWRPFLVSMMAALVAEAALCLPRPSRRPGVATAGAAS